MELTKKDIEKIEEEIRYRAGVLKPDLLKSLKEARSQGDLSENFEYVMAKRANNQNNSRIRYLENIVRTATIIEDKEPEDVAGINKRVTIYVPDADEERTYKIVTTIRSNTLEQRVSNVSPLGKALIGHRVGDTVTVEVNPDISYEAVIRKIVPVEDDGSDGIKQY